MRAVLVSSSGHLLIVTAELEGLQGPLQAADVCTSRNHTHLSTDWTVVSCMSIRGGQSAAGDVLVEGTLHIKIPDRALLHRNIYLAAEITNQSLRP